MNVVLKPGKDKAIRHHHHWIFSGAIKRWPPCENGDILGVESAQGDFLGYGYFHRGTSIAGRMLSFDTTPPQTAVQELIQRAARFRSMLFNHKTTNAYRLIHSEGDGIPGLIVDQYADTLVMQISTLGIEKIKPTIIAELRSELQPRTIWEKSDNPSRTEEGLPPLEGILWGKPPGMVDIIENDLPFTVDIIHGQKTGFFLDQRENRAWVRSLARDRTVLNCFGYTGGFSLAALSGGARYAKTVDTSEEAICHANLHAERMGFTQSHEGIIADVFTYLREAEIEENFIILDPPAFAKHKTDVIRACRGYKDINRLAMMKIPPGGLLLTCSCSYHIDEKLFQTVVFQAASEAKRRVRIIGRHHLAPDHPVNIFHPEGEYLKSLLLYVE